MALPAPSTMIDYAKIVADTVRFTRIGAIRIFDPARATPGAAYDPVTDTGGQDSPFVLWEGAARIQPLIIQEPQSANGDWTPKRRFHIDIDIDDDTPFFRKGLPIRITDGGLDKSLEHIHLTIISAVNSAAAAQRTIIAVSELADVPPLTPPIS